ncbi:MAG: transcriptional regulator [Balneolaceae bacterium]|nr:transcriptional regulator [Balneolaceae bacterium]
MSFDDLDPLLHSQLRLAVMSLLLSVEHADFTYLMEQTGATSGNMSVQLSKLEEAGYIEVEKTFVDRKPRTRCRITPQGLEAFESYVDTLKQYIDPDDSSTPEPPSTEND